MLRSSSASMILLLFPWWIWSSVWSASSQLMMPMDVMEQEATEDIEKMAAIMPTEKPYMKTSVFETYKKRIPWLLLLMISATFTSMIIKHYEAALQRRRSCLRIFQC